MPPRRSIRDEDWERLRPIIRKHYLEEDQNLKDVLLILGISHSLYPSKAQLEWKLRQWHFTKNMGLMDWKYVGNEIHRRKCRGKESKVYLSGIPLQMKNIERRVSRNYETAIEKAMRHVPEPPLPEDQPLLVCTPAPEEMGWPWRLDNIPWLLSRRIVEGLAIKVSNQMSISYHSSEELVAFFLLPDVVLQSYTTLLGKTFEKLRSIMPEECEGAHAIRAQALLQKSRSDTINAEFLVCLMFLWSNNLLRCRSGLDHERDTAIRHSLLRLFRESRSDVLGKGRYSSLLQSLQSLLDGLFRKAIRGSDIGAIELLLQAGVDVNMTFSDLFGLSPLCGTALQHAAVSNQPELLQMLIEHGSDTQKIDIETLTMAWLQRKMAKGSPEETMRILLSLYRFRSGDEIQAVQLLSWMSYTLATPVTEAVIEFFRSNFSESSSAAKAQLLIAAIRTNSCFVNDLVAELGHCLNSCGYYPETPMTAAVFVGDIQLCEQLLHLGAMFEPDHTAPTPLQWAASFSDVSIVQMLLDWGADVNFCHPHATLLRVGFEDITSMRFSYMVHNHSEREKQHGLIGSLGRTALQASLLGGNIATAVFLLAAGAELVGGELVMAIWSRQFEIIEHLLERGASFQDECTIFGTDTVIEAAILSGNTNLVHRVIAADERSVTGQALCASVCLSKATGDLTILKYLLTYQSQLLASQDTWFGTAMCLAAALQCMEIPEMMLSSGLHPETSWYFFYSSHSQLRDALVRSGRSTSDTPIIRAYLSWRRGLRTCFKDHRQSPSRSIIETAVCLHHMDLLKLLVGYGYQPGPTNPLDIGFRHPLSIELLRFLHSIGIRMTERALVHAIFRNASVGEAIPWLLSVGVDINERSDDAQCLARNFAGYWFPWTPLQTAVLNGDVGLIQQLIEYGAEVNESPYAHGGSTSLQMAALRGFFGIARRLLELGADPNAPGTDCPRGRTAIESAAEYGRLDIVQLLLNSGVETSGCGRRQIVRSVAFARREGHHAIVRILKSQAGWTEAYENLLGEKDVIPVDPSEDTIMPAYVRRYYGDESDGEGPAGGVTSKEDQSLDEVESNTEERRSSSELRSDLEESSPNSKEISQALAKESLSGGVDTSEKALLSTLDPISNLPDAYEALSEEVGLEFLPSSMSYQIREELEGDGCLEESGGDLWAEEYSRFVTELV